MPTRSATSLHVCDTTTVTQRRLSLTFLCWTRKIFCTTYIRMNSESITSSTLLKHAYFSLFFTQACIQSIQTIQKCPVLLITFEHVIKSLSFNEPKLLELLFDSLSRLSFSLRKLGLFNRACNDFLHIVNTNYKQVLVVTWNWHHICHLLFIV